jgi:rSAM/selenodomain-associated transferase 1
VNARADDMSPHRKCGIGVMARAPSAGKTRLAPYLPPPRLEALGAALLADTLDVVERARHDGDEAVLFFTPPGSEGEISALAPASFARACQPAGDLGQRMRAAFDDLLGARRCDVAVLVGSDIPFLSESAITDARDRLRSSRGVVLGPADDGGYYLIGMSQVHAALFEEIEWSTARVLADTLRVAGRLGIAATLVRGAYDIDTIEDLRRLEREMSSAPAGAAPRVRHWLATSN